ncbi:MAG: hypothetical protein ACI4R5_04335 [Acetatifactor sp.]
MAMYFQACYTIGGIRGRRRQIESRLGERENWELQGQRNERNYGCLTGKKCISRYMYRQTGILPQGGTQDKAHPCGR